ncbi:hypothetical protein PsYK624_161030 [Phanerochaete sordida]|uniref:Uncharacterized protein n=1 Tax=Phanerochaete sordida TaxID=48140 RepID=A0A9P3GQD6_9APHY|nr:hypothetical protein PsYK624_161030 [Phanerochaete sordida]
MYYMVHAAQMIQALSAASPDLLDAVLLTGFSANSTAQPPFLAGGDFQPAAIVAPARFADQGIPDAYLVNQSPYNTQFMTYFFPYFPEDALQRTYQTGQPVTQGVLFTQGVIMQNATDFTGAVHVVTGAQDFPFCDGNCYAVPSGGPYTSIPAYTKTFYPSASNFSVYIPANTGHNINGHYSAPEVFQDMLQFVESVFSPSQSL